MFGRAERDNESEANATVRCSGSLPNELQRGCREFFEAHFAIAALGSQSTWPSDFDEPTSAMPLASLRRDRDRALDAVRRFQSKERSDLQAKLGVYLALEDWFGFEGGSVAEFGSEILHEVASLMAANQSALLPTDLIQQIPSSGRAAWFDRLPRLPWFAQNPSPPLSESVRRSQD